VGQKREQQNIARQQKRPSCRAFLCFGGTCDFRRKGHGGAQKRARKTFGIPKKTVAISRH
jgi:hypothetical protein